MGSSVHIISLHFMHRNVINETPSWPPCVEGGADAIKKRTSSIKGNFIELVPRGNVMIGQTSQNKFNSRTDVVEIH